MSLNIAVVSAEINMGGPMGAQHRYTRVLQPGCNQFGSNDLNGCTSILSHLGPLGLLANHFELHLVGVNTVMLVCHGPVDELNGNWIPTVPICKLINQSSIKIALNSPHVGEPGGFSGYVTYTLNFYRKR